MKKVFLFLFIFVTVVALFSELSETDVKKYQVPVYGQDSLLVMDSLVVKADVYIVNFDIDSINVHYLNPAVRSIVTKYIFRKKNQILVDAYKLDSEVYNALYVLKKSSGTAILDSVKTENRKVDYFALVDSVLNIEDETHRKYTISEGFHYEGFHEFNKLIRRDGMLFISDKVSLPLYYQTFNRFYLCDETESTLRLKSKYYELEPMMVKAYMATGDYSYDFIVLEVGKNKIFGKDIQFRFDYVGLDGEIYDNRLQVVKETNSSMHLQLKLPFSYGEIETRYINTRQKVPETKVLRNPITFNGSENYYTHEYSLMYRSDLVNINYKLYSDKLDSTEVYDNLFSINKNFTYGNHNLDASMQFSVNSTREFSGLFADYTFNNDFISGKWNSVFGEKTVWASGDLKYEGLNLISAGVYADYTDRDVDDILSLSYKDLHYNEVNSGIILQTDRFVDASVKAGYSINKLSLKFLTSSDDNELEIESPFFSADIEKDFKYRNFILNSEFGIKYEYEKFYMDNEVSLTYELKHNNRITAGLRYQFDDNTIYYRSLSLYNANYLNAFVRLDITKKFSATGEFRNITDETQIYGVDLMPVHFFVKLKWYFFN